MTGRARHPTLDVSLLDFDDPGGPALPVAAAAPTVGSPVLLTGYGLSESGTIGERRYAETAVLASDQTTFTVSSGGRTGACVGDSGGPLLTAGANRGYELTGVLSQGSLSCKAQDVYTSLLAVKGWLDQLDPL